jgi:anti-anti-sigma regulatory factor
MTHFQLPEDLLADNLATVALQLEAVLVDSPELIEVDAHALELVDTAGMQLLYAFVRDAWQDGKRVAWKDPTPQFEEAARVLGMSHALGLE